MRKKTENIRLVFVWITGLFLLSHGIIPHHHHFDSVYDHRQQSNQQEEDNPLHCHAFNHLVPEKTTGHNVNILPVAVVDSDYCFDSINEPGNIFQDYFVKIFVYKYPYLKHSPTRGSPLFS